MADYITIQSVTVDTKNKVTIFDVGQTQLPPNLLGAEIFIVYDANWTTVTNVDGSTFTIEGQYPDGTINLDNPLTLGITGIYPENYFFLFGLTENTPITYAEFDAEYSISYYDSELNAFAINGANSLSVDEGTEVDVSVYEETKKITYSGDNKLFSLGDQYFGFDLFEGAPVILSAYVPPAPTKGYPPKEYSYYEYINLIRDGKWPYSPLQENKIYYLPKIVEKELDLEYQTIIALFPPNYNEGKKQFVGNTVPSDVPIEIPPIVTIPTTLTKQGRLFFLKEDPQTGPVEKNIEAYGSFDEQNNKPYIFPANDRDTTLENFPLGTVLTWTDFEQTVYSAATDGNIYYSSEKETVYVGTYLNFGENQPIFPQEQPFTVSTTVNETVYQKYNLIGYDVDNNLILNETYNPTDYDVTGFTVLTQFEIIKQ